MKNQDLDINLPQHLVTFISYHDSQVFFLLAKQLDVVAFLKKLTPPGETSLGQLLVSSMALTKASIFTEGIRGRGGYS